MTRKTVVVVALGVLLLGAGGSALAAYRYERSPETRILPGIKIDEVSVGNMTSSEAMTAVSRAAEAELSRRVVIEAGPKRWTRSLRELGVTADVAGAVMRTVSLTRSYSLIARAYHRWAEPIRRNLSAFRLRSGAIKSFIRKAAKEIGRPPRDAGFELENHKVVRKRARPGLELSVDESVDRVRTAVLARETNVRLLVRRVAAKVTLRDLDKTIVVDVSENKLHLYDRFRRARIYPVGTAMRGFATPEGEWEVVAKEKNPTWNNPDPNGWGKDLPLVIPPGPDNPLGTRALRLDAPGILIHGTYEDDSVGKYSSHGCIRMHIPHSEALFRLVDVGTPVFIVGTPPWGPEDNPGIPG